MAITNKLKETILNGGTAIGCFTTMPTPEIVELLAIGGMDFVLFDAEHSQLNPALCYPLQLAAEKHGLPTLARVGENDRQTHIKYLELGIGGVLVPQTNTLEDARKAVEGMRYGPRGTRGYAPSRLIDWAQRGTQPDLMQEASEYVFTMVQFEHIDAMADLEQVLALPELDLLFVGPNDLAQSMGYPGQPNHPEVQDVIEQVIRIAQDAGMPLGTVSPDAAATNRQLERGFQLVATNVVSLFTSGMQHYFAGVTSRGGQTDA
ncbi:MAG TPA: aldolase/citrate lyase family protein [Thermomicrobiales bacterium]|nr:aldolase/citrate lyase family protein [Thermomicrobiales bacterium]